MPQISDKQAARLEPGARVRVCDDTLQAFYGICGTVLRVGTCSHTGAITRVDVQMDDLPAQEGPASFYPHEVDQYSPSQGAIL